MELRTFRSGSLKDVEHTPNLTPRGYEIKKDELYVLGGDTIIKAYNILMSSRFSALQMVAKMSPDKVAEIDEYLTVAKYINSVLYQVITSIPLANILQMQDEAKLAEKEKGNAERKTGLSLNEIFEKFHIKDGGTKDELPPKTPPPETEK